MTGKIEHPHAANSPSYSRHCIESRERVYILYMFHSAHIDITYYVL